MDETAWYYNMDQGYSYCFKGYDNVESSASKGKRVSLVAAIST